MIGALLALAVLAGPPEPPRLYVANQDDASVSVIDAATLELVATVDLEALGFGPAARPHHAQVEPDGSAWYLTLIGAGKLLKFDRANRIVASLDLEVPGLITLDPKADRLVVGRSMSAVSPPSRVALVRRSDLQLLDEYDVFFPRPHALVAHPGGGYAYVASLGVNQLASLRLEDGHLELVEVPGPPHTLSQFSVSPDGRWLLATAETSSLLLVFDLADPARPRLAREVPMEKGPFESVFSWDGRTVFVTNLTANVVTVVDAETWVPVAVLRDPSFVQPHGLALSPDGRYVFVSSRHQSGGAHDHEGMKATAHGTVTAICIPTRGVERVIAVENYAAGMGAPRPDPLPATPASCR